MAEMLWSGCLCDADEKIAELELIDGQTVIEEEEKEHRIIRFGYYVRIPELNLDIHEGVCEVWDDLERRYTVDYALSLIYRQDEEELIYQEQDDMIATLFNYLRIDNREMLISNIEDIRCELWFDKDGNRN